MKFPLLFLTTLLPVADATTIKTDRKLNPEDVKKIVETSKSNIPRLTQDYDPCASAQEAIYTDPAMAPAYFPSFVYTFLWKDPSFDMAGYFDALNFDTKCVELGGEVWQRDIKLNCGEGDTTWTEFKWCKPTVCDEFAYTLTQDYTVAYLGQLIECDMELVDDTTPSIECIMGIDAVYGNGTALEQFAPEGALSEDGVGAIEELGACRQFGSNGYDIGVCDMPTLEDEYQLITNLCETGNEAKIVPFDMTFTVPFYHRTMKRYPVCVPNVCSMKDTFLYYGLIAQAYEDSVVGFSLDVDFKQSLVNNCDEIPRNKAFMKQFNGKVTIKSCKWLNNRPDNLKNKFCNKKSGNGGYKTAGEVCPSTCCLCEEQEGDVFLKKMRLSATGEFSLETKTCEWLANLSADKREFHCGKTGASFVGGYPPASAACPGVCGCTE